jgi:acyl-CoA thioester hydrolase
MGKPAGYEIDIATHPEWIDYNGHVTDAAFAIIAAEANEAALERIGMSEAYRRETGHALYSARLEIDFRAEIPPTGTITITSSVESIGRTSVTMTATISRSDGEIAAETKHVYVLVDGAASARVPLSPEQRRALDSYKLARNDKGR